MEIIPVIDLMGGLAVLAQGGERKRYQPLQTPICESSEPAQVIEAFLRIYPFRKMYFADLDRLTGQGDQIIQLRNLHERFPQLEFWLDSGWPLRSGPWIPVVGSESLNSENWRQIDDIHQQWILSLDFKGDEFRGPDALLAHPKHWPETVLVMSLHRVGSCSGPDVQRLQTLQKQAPRKQWVAAGGVRNSQDLEALEALGVRTALIASALHNGNIRP
jgi:phosphoribosylformimino-5-aminoimidazole carboxamide ribotide isomerase